MLVNKRLKPKKDFKVFIQFPGLGKNLINPGKKIVKINGNAKPKPTNVKMRNITPVP